MLKAIIKTIIICFALSISISANAMNNTIYSYTVEEGTLSLWDATIPEDMETLEIPEQIGGVPVTSIADNFVIKQVDVRYAAVGEIYAYMARTDLMIDPLHQFGLKTIIVPDSVQKISGNMVHEFKQEKSVVDLQIPENTVITDEISPNIFFWAPDLHSFYLRYGKDVSAESSDKPNDLSEVGVPADLYVDGRYIDGCVIYNGVSYVPFTSGILSRHNRSVETFAKDGAPYSMWYSDLGGFGKSRELMIIDCKIKTPEKFLDEKSAYTSKENAKYEMTGKQIMFNADTDKVTTIEIYRPLDETEAVPLYTSEINGVSGGQVQIESMPIFYGYIPVRIACEAAQRKVEWDGETNTIYVTTPEE